MRRRRLWDVDVPFELVCEVAGAGAVAEAGDVEGSAASARHGGAVIKTECGRSDTDTAVETGRVVVRVEVMGWLGDGRQRAAKDLSEMELAGAWRTTTRDRRAAGANQRHSAETRRPAQTAGWACRLGLPARHVYDRDETRPILTAATYCSHALSR